MGRNSPGADAAGGFVQEGPVLRDQPGHEYGYAAVGLALLGDRGSIDCIGGAPRINVGGPYCDLALRALARNDE